jgi:hypothetical protein
MSCLKRTVLYCNLVIPFLVICCRPSVKDRKTAAEQAAITYFVNNKTGNDKNPGTYELPVRTISRLNILLSENAGSACFAGGQTYDGTVILKNISWLNVTGSDSPRLQNITIQDCMVLIQNSMIYNNIFYNDAGLIYADLTDPWKLKELTGLALKNNSPLKGKGLDLLALYGFAGPMEDFFGNKIPEGSVSAPGISDLK